jgi:hypothetical protein
MVIALAIITFMFSETIGFLAYKVFQLSKALKATEENVDRLADCVLTISKHISKVEIIDNTDISSTDFTFPNREGF